MTWEGESEIKSFSTFSLDIGKMNMSNFDTEKPDINDG